MKKTSADFTHDDIEQVFLKYGLLDPVIKLSDFSLSWFAEQILVKGGKPLCLQPFQSVILDGLWEGKFVIMIMGRGCSKTFLIALYAILRAILNPGSKVVIVGAAFRQAKNVFKYIEELYYGSPLLQECAPKGVRWLNDNVIINIGSSYIKGIPLGTGEKVRGERATHLLLDEAASVNESIFEHAIAPFTAVSSDPSTKANVMRFARRLEKLGADKELINTILTSQGAGNQMVISGSASYKENHLCKRYKLYKSIISSSGDIEKLKDSMMKNIDHPLELTEEDYLSYAASWKKYFIFQIPYTFLPEGFMDETFIRSQKGQMPKHRFSMEYLAEFPEDTDGFIKRSWIEEATPKRNIMDPGSFPVIPELYGDPRSIYVMGLDPAKHNDNFGCVVLKLTERGKELVYCNAWNKTEYNKSAKIIRDIIKRFPIAYVAMDQDGGGSSVIEWLYKNSPEIDPQDYIWPIPEQIEKFTNSTTGLSAPGKKIIELVKFNSNWISEAAHSIEAAIQQKNILFPDGSLSDEDIYHQYLRYTGKSDLSNAEKEILQIEMWGADEWEVDKFSKTYNLQAAPTLGILQQINECINETCAIARQVTPKGVESFELPSMSEQIEGLDLRRRDRWSALMLANYAARVFQGHGHKIKLFPGSYSAKSSSYTKGSFNRKGSVSW